MKLNREDFIQYWMTRDRLEQGWGVLFFLVPYLAGIILFSLPIRYIEKDPVWAWVWFPAFFLYLLLLPLAWRRLRGPKLRSEFERCPCCKRRMLGANHLVTTATSNCGACGETILSDRI